MPLLHKANNISAPSEDEMQRQICEYLLHYDFARGLNYKPPVETFRETTIKEIGRRSDIIFRLGGTFYNIECKLTGVRKVFEQAKDHLIWADYSCIALDHRAYISSAFVRLFAKYGIGLFLWNHSKSELTEAVYARYVTGRSDEDKKIRRSVINSLSIQQVKIF